MPFGDMQTPFQHSGAERLSRQHCLRSGKEHEEKASEYKYQGIRLLLHVQLQYRQLLWQRCGISKTLKYFLHKWLPLKALFLGLS